MKLLQMGEPEAEDADTPGWELGGGVFIRWVAIDRNTSWRARTRRGGVEEGLLSSWDSAL